MIKYTIAENFNDLFQYVNNGATHIAIQQTGLTASYGFMKLAVEYCHPLNVKVYAVINPRIESHCYTLFDTEMMREDIIQFNKLHVDGFIFGALDRDNGLDIKTMRTLVQTAGSTPVIMSTAFDKIPMRTQLKAMDALIDMGISALMTHGSASYLSSVTENIHQLGRLLRHSKGQIEIIPEVMSDSEIKKLTEWIPFQYVYGRDI
ncbi:copper homeostasis protein CutC [Macrococcus armenti]|uniref:copper homeostasis protein CutC n=1 Tax=Macrococcus armenti TaxID=2875764 RepID=UPI001CD00B01|nr:copper homeostasis protein CutC [Macrococcus armenti]UBH12517.1 copper homeostasis protein CutC [Macrococcus armenti]UBH21673.1 copper homeostasis protein CutC [Macrococcus armenti]